MSNTFQTIEEVNARVLATYSILHLRELSPEQIERCEELLSKSNDVVLVDSGTMNLIDWWKVQSNGHFYEVRRFEKFSFCSCAAFFFNKFCKHIAFTFPAICPKCQRPSETKGEKCQRCFESEAMYCKPQIQSEKLGGFRI